MINDTHILKNQETPTPTPLGSYPIDYMCCAIVGDIIDCSWMSNFVFQCQ